MTVYYNSLLHNKKGIIICLFDTSNVLIGFAAGSMCSKGFHKNILLENIASYIWVMMKIVLLRPKAIVRLFKNLNKSKNDYKDDGKYAELLSISVPPKNKGKGYGKMLLGEFETKLQKLNIDRIVLTTDYTDNDRVITFYNNLGYKKMYKFTAFPKREMYKLIKNI